MIKCPKCQADNMIGAIFCRGCGAKLEIEDLKPDTIRASGQPKGMNVRKIVRNVVTLVVFVVVLGTLALIFLPPSLQAPPAYSDNVYNSAKDKLGKLVGGSIPQATFNSEEINTLARGIFGLSPAGFVDRQKAIAEGKITDNSALTCADIVINFESGRAKVYLKCLFFGQLPVYTTVEGSVGAGESGLTFTPDTYAFGMLPMPVSFFQETILDRFRALTNGNTTYEKFRDNVCKKLQKVEIKSASEVTVSCK